jgi:peptidoglycan/xylan/chitin deacetylase (PgdA/CDA1 family)
MSDFTLKVYRDLLMAIRSAGYGFYTFAEWCEGNAKGKFVLLRHDIDKSPKHALNTARLENDLGITSTYYFRTSKNILNPDIVKEIASYGHEVGYHYRDLVDNAGNVDKAISDFRSNLLKLRQLVKVKTIAMDGCPWSKYDNRDLWKKYNYRDFDIIGEPYFDFLYPHSAINNENGLSEPKKILYFTDTARMWDGDKYNVRDKIDKSLIEQSKKSNFRILQNPKIHSTFDFINWLKSSHEVSAMMITTHPQRWTDNRMEWLMELLLQSVKNKLKRLLICCR